MVENSYEVHLTSDATGGDASVESPVRTDRVDFYDSGVWVDQRPGRDFYPYAKIQVIRERPAGAFEESTAGGEETGETLGEAASGDDGEDGDGLSVE